MSEQWSYDPIHLTRLFISRHADAYMTKYEEEPSPALRKTTRFAIENATASELEVAMLAYGAENGLHTITFDDPEFESVGILTHLMQQQRFVDHQLDAQKDGLTLGVFDAKHRTFTPCDFGAHWTTMLKILKQTDPDIASDIYDAKFNRPLKYHTASELDILILSRFTLVGGENDASIKHTF